MNNLKELARVVERNKMKQIEIIGSNGNYNSKIDVLYQGIISGHFDSDEKAAQALYGTDASNINYKKLKYRLEKRLINSVFFIDVNKASFNDLQAAYYTCYKNFAALRILEGRLATKSALQLAYKTLQQTLKFELTELNVLLLSFLADREGLHKGDYKKAKYYRTLQREYEGILQAELKTRELYTNLKIQILKAGTSDPVTLQLAKKYEKQIKKYFKKYESFRLMEQGFLTIYTRYEITKDYKGIVQACREAIRYFESKEIGIHKVILARFYYRMMAGYIFLKEYSQAEDAAIKCIRLVDSGTNTWALYRSYYVLLCLHSGQYGKAFDIYYETKKQKNFNQLNLRSRELWLTIEAFIHYLIKIGKINRQPKKPFRLHTFLNNVPAFSKEKRSGNIPILILQVLFLLEQKKYEKVNDRVDALSMYCSRYLKHGDTFRDNCFIKMLIQLPRAQFHQAGVIRKTAKYRKRLTEMPLATAGQDINTEIIPYEQLWEMVIDSLEDKFYYL